MAEFDEGRKRLTLKLVFYGPALSGKTTNLTRLHDLLAPELIGEMMMLETEGDRTLFFDLLPFGITAPSGLLIKMKVFTVPGQVMHDGTRKAILSRADGVVFVADSQKNQAENNAASFQNLIANIGIVGLNAQTLPLVVQFNKRDLPEILCEEEIISRWNETRWPLFFASALAGKGVLETFRALLDQLYDDLDVKFNLKTAHGLSRDMYLSSIGVRS